MTIEEGASLPEAKTLTAKDNCVGNWQVAPSVSKANNKVVYLWKATDSCGNSIVHTQTISIHIKPQIATPTVSTPTVSTPTVSSPTEISPEVSEVIIYNGVSTHNSHNYFKVENTDENRPIYVIIFDEMGLKVYENPDYGKPEVFRGYANVKNVIGKKALAGTYFYILRYYKNNILEEKKGFLYIR